MKRNLLLAFLTMLTTFSLFAQRNVTGTITSSDENESLPGVSVIVRGTTIGTVSDLDGKYIISVPEGYTYLIFSYIGMKTKEVALGSDNSLNVALDPDVLGLDEVVVTAIGIERSKKALGYAVQEVGGDEITQAHETNVISALASKVAGVHVNKSSGAAGGSSYIVIRGANTIRGNNQPLIVIDGVPVDNSQISSGNPDNGRNNYLYGVANSNRAIDIPQEDIETISVLKGAAATALYGSQAGNGAIIITTKKGKAGKKGLNINFSTGVDYNSYNQMVPLQNQWSQGLFGGISGPESGSGYSWGALIDTLVYDPATTGVYIHDKNGKLVGQSAAPGGKKAAPYNNIDDFYRTGVTFNTNLSLSGASDKTNYFFSIGHLAEDGIIPKNDFKRTNIGFNGELIVTKNFKIGSSVKYINSGGTRIEQGSNTSGVMLGLLRTSPTFDNSNGFGEDAADEVSAYQFPDGKQRNYRGGGGYDNPFWTVNKNPLEDNVNRVIGHIEFNYQLAPWLKAHYKVGQDWYSDRRKQHFAIGSRTLTAGRIIEDQHFVKDFNEDLMLLINKDLSEDLALGVTLGHNRRSSYHQQSYMQGDGLSIPDFYHMSNTASQLTRESVERSRDQALYLMAEVAYADMLYLTLTGRNEWSTTLPEGNNSFFYPSASLGFVFTEAFGMTDNNVLPYGKLRLSYAQVGLGSPFLYATDDYYTVSSYGDGWTDGIYYPFGGITGFELGNVLGSPDLKPERNTQMEVGLDLRFLNNRLGVDVTLYNSTSTDLIFPVPVTGSTGYTFAILNAGEMTNKGVEVVLNATPVKTGDFNWDMNLNFTKNTNEVVKLAEGVDNVFLGGFTGANIRAEVGSSYGTVFGFGFYRDASGAMVIGDDGFPVLDPEERGFGDAAADWTIGWRNSFSWKGISLSALLDFRKGGVMWNGTKGALYFWGTHAETDVRGESKTFEGNLATYDGSGNLILDADGVPVTAGSNNIEVVLDENWLAFGNGNGFFGDNTEDFVEDISWTRLRELTLSYRLPSNVLSNTPFVSADVFFTGRNLFLQTPYTGVDPETSLAGSRNEQGMDYFNMPGTKSYGVGVKLTL